ncbi:MAG: hypothetical protein WDO74_08650 [Pseudomonadota bacterium]
MSRKVGLSGAIGCDRALLPSAFFPSDALQLAAKTDLAQTDERHLLETATASAGGPCVGYCRQSQVLLGKVYEALLPDNFEETAADLALAQDDSAA